MQRNNRLKQSAPHAAVLSGGYLYGHHVAYHRAPDNGVNQRKSLNVLMFGPGVQRMEGQPVASPQDTVFKYTMAL